MRESGYAMKCARCGRTEFVSRKNLDKSGWKDVNVVSSNADEPLDICPICARLFKAMYETFFSSHENGVICYTMDGYPVIFDPDALAYHEPVKNEEKKVDIPYIEPKKLDWKNSKYLMGGILFEKKVFEDPGVVNIHVEKEDEDDE